MSVAAQTFVAHAGGTGWDELLLMGLPLLLAAAIYAVGSRQLRDEPLTVPVDETES